MATTEELNAAVDDLRADNYGLSRHDAADKEADQALLAEAYLAHIAEQERVATERVTPITEEWLESIGFSSVFESVFNIYCDGTAIGVFSSPSGTWWQAEIDDADWPVEMTTRGEVLDLLAALKIPTKGA